jgi:hypothetical protein
MRTRTAGAFGLNDPFILLPDDNRDALMQIGHR